MEKLLKEQDQSYDDYVKDFLAQDDAAQNAALAGNFQRMRDGEILEATARRQRTVERAMEMKSLLEARDAEVASTEAQALREQNRLADEQTAMRDREAMRSEAREMRAQEEAANVEQMQPISDPRIPNGARIIFTPSKKYRVYYTGAGLVGVTDNLESALKLSNKYATRKVSVR